MSDRFYGSVRAGAISVSVPFTLTKTVDGTEQTGKTAADMTASYLLQGGTRTAIILSDLVAVNSVWSSGGVKEIDATNMPGLYRLDVPNAAFTGADWVVISVKVASCFVYYVFLALETTLLSRTVSSGATAGTVEHALAVSRAGAVGTNDVGATTANVQVLKDTDGTTLMTADLTPVGGPYTKRVPR